MVGRQINTMHTHTLALTCRVESVDIDGQIHGLGSADALVDLLDDAFHSDRVDLACFHDFKPAVSVVFVVAGSAQSCADAGVDVAVVCEQAFLGGVKEVRSVVDFSLRRRRSTKNRWLPASKEVRYCCTIEYEPHVSR